MIFSQKVGFYQPQHKNRIFQLNLLFSSPVIVHINNTVRK